MSYRKVSNAFRSHNGVAQHESLDHPGNMEPSLPELFAMIMIGGHTDRCGACQMLA